MYLISYLAQDDAHIAAVQDRLAFARPTFVLVVAHSVSEMLDQAETLPLRGILIDLAWPRAVWQESSASLRSSHPALPILALTAAHTSEPWWELADDQVCLDDPLDLFLFRIRHAVHLEPSTPERDAPAFALAPVVTSASAPGLLENAQFRQFAQIFSRLDEPTIIKAFIAWAQQACQTSRAVLLLRDAESGDFVCRAQRGLPAALAPFCRFPQTAPLCRWLMSSGRILVRDHVHSYPLELNDGLELMQAVAAVPMIFEGQLVGILGIGPQLMGPGYSTTEIEGLFALCGHMAMTLHHCQMHRAVQQQQQMTAHMLRSMPIGIFVLGDDERIAFANAAAAQIVGSTRDSLEGLDLRTIPSPLGDLAFEILTTRLPLPRRELCVMTSQLPVAVTGFPLATSPPTAMLLLEDLSAQKELEVEHERRVDLEVVTNLVHYLAHELRNPLVSLATYVNLVPTHAEDPQFHVFSQSILQPELIRINLILEQLVVLTNHAEFHFSTFELDNLLQHVLSDELREQVEVTSPPAPLLTFYGDAHRLETAFTCLLRTAVRLKLRQEPVSLIVKQEGEIIEVRVECALQASIEPAWMLDPWQQLLEHSEEQVDFGLATAKHIIEQHEGTLTVQVTNLVLSMFIRLPLRTGPEFFGETQHAEKSFRR